MKNKNKKRIIFFICILSVLFISLTFFHIKRDAIVLNDKEQIETTAKEPIKDVTTQATTKELVKDVTTQATTKNPIKETATQATTKNPIKETATQATTTQITTKKPIKETATQATTKKPIKETTTQATTKAPVNNGGGSSSSDEDFWNEAEKILGPTIDTGEVGGAEEANFKLTGKQIGQ